MGRLRFVALLAVVLAAVDLVFAKAAEHNHPGFDHHRSFVWVGLSLLVFVFVGALACVPSRLLALGCGLQAGGTLGNLLWALSHHNVVSNSFVLQGGEGGIAFTLADVFVLVGIAVIVVGSMRMTIRYRHVLPRSTVGVRLFRRLALAIRR
ncbi:MAG TPA: hypothetical protein VNH45_03275 [Gaiellaceae bacterium]|jgi:lipoprotein signal peptidase|nr:hypothetical protein [Gaiellaceae bacterium]